MPIFEFQCSACGHISEVFQQSRDAKSPRCPLCRGKTRKIISQTAFILKGSGWYVTDYPSSSRKAAMDAEHKGKEKKETSTPKKKGDSTAKRKSSPSGD